MGDQKIRLSKSRLMRGFQCPKSLYLTIHNPDLEPPVSASQQVLFDQGHEVGLAAQKEFPGGILIQAPYYDTKSAVAQTQEAVTRGANTIFEATFATEALTARVDVLHRPSPTASWHLIEVKSSTSVKPEYLDDVAIQAQVLADCGQQIDRFSVMHLNNKSTAPDLNDLFQRVDVTRQIAERRQEVLKKLTSLQETVSKPEAPARMASPIERSPCTSESRRRWRRNTRHKVSVIVSAAWRGWSEWTTTSKKAETRSPSRRPSGSSRTTTDLWVNAIPQRFLHGLKPRLLISRRSWTSRGSRTICRRCVPIRNIPSRPWPSAPAATAMVAEIADQAFMQDVIARDLRGAVPRDQRERIQRDRRIADIVDLVVDGEEVTVVDRNDAAEGQAFAIVVFSVTGLFGASVLLPSCCHSVVWSGSLTAALVPETQPNSA